MKTFRQLSEIIMPQVKNDLEGMDKMSFVKKHGVSKSMAKQKLATEAKDEQEYGYEGDMALNQLATLIRCGEMIKDMLKPDTDMPEWVQSKITLATDYIQTAADYMYSEMNEGHQVVATTKQGETFKSGVHATKEKALSQHYKMAKSGNYKKVDTVKTEEVQIDELSSDLLGRYKTAAGADASKADKAGDYNKGNKRFSGIMKATKKQFANDMKKESVMEMDKSQTPPGRDGPPRPGPDIYVKPITAKKFKNHALSILQKSLQAKDKKKPMNETLEEGRPSQRHPLEGHEYHKKTDAELVHIAKDAHAAAEAMKSHNTTAENKYRDQANDSATVRHFRKTSGTPDWYKKKYGHMKEEMDCNQSKAGVNCSVHGMKDCTPGQMKETFKPMDEPNYNNSIEARQKKADDANKPPFDGPYKKSTGVVTDKSGAKHGGMSIARNLAKQAMKKQASKMSVKEGLEESRKAEIVKEIMKKGKKKEDNTFQGEPELGSTVVKADN